MNANPRCSVIIPTYNCLDLLPVAVASVRMQGVQDVEILIIDDASTDGTAEWLAAEMARRKFALQCIHGELEPAERRARMEAFRSGAARVGVALRRQKARHLRHSERRMVDVHPQCPGRVGRP